MVGRSRLMVVASTFPGQDGDGTPAFVRDLSSRLSDTFDTVVLVPRVPGASRREKIGDLTVERFPYFLRRWEDLADGAILENLREKRTRWLQVPFFLAAEAFHLRRLIRRHRPDVLHVHWVVPQGVAALVGARSVPWVVTTLGGDVYALKDPLSRRLKRAVLRRAQAVTTMNVEMRGRLIESGSAPETTYVQVLGADMDGVRQAAAGESEIPGRLLFAGRLVEKKGAAILLDALRQLPTDLDWTLEIVGDGPLRAALEAQAQGLPVHFSGAASREDLAKAYARSAVVVVPSTPAASGDQDGLPTVLLEAMGVGRPIVASDLPGIDEAIEHGETGLLTPANDPAALADVLARALSDASLRSRLGLAARLRSDDFTIDACAKRFVDILSTAASSTLEGHGSDNGDR